MGLIRQRKPSSATGRANERVVAAVLEALRRQRGRSTGTLKGLREVTGQILADVHGPGAVALPAPSTFNRLVRVLADPLEPGASRPHRHRRAGAAVHAGGGAAAGRADTGRHHPAGHHGHRRGRKAGAPGAHDRPDVATRSVVAAVLREQSTQAVDAALLLAEMAMPHPVRPGWGEHLRLAHAAVPYDRLLALDARLEQAAARPVVVPETIVISRGRVFLSAAFLAACESLGVSVQPAPPRSPTAKGAVERSGLRRKPFPIEPRPGGRLRPRSAVQTGSGRRPVATSRCKPSNTGLRRHGPCCPSRTNAGNRRCLYSP